MFGFSKNFFSLSFATLLLIILAGCSAATEAVNNYPPTDSLSALECQTNTGYESTDHLGCVERIFQDIPLTPGFEGKCVALDVEPWDKHTDRIKELAESFSDIGSSCDAYTRPEPFERGLYKTITEVELNGFISFSYSPVIAPNSEITGYYHQWDNDVITQEMLLTGTCFLLSRGNVGNKILFKFFKT